MLAGSSPLHRTAVNGADSPYWLIRLQGCLHTSPAMPLVRGIASGFGDVRSFVRRCGRPRRAGPRGRLRKACRKECRYADRHRQRARPGDRQRPGEQGLLVSPEEVLHIDAGRLAALVQAAQEGAGAGFQRQGHIGAPERLELAPHGCLDDEQASSHNGVPVREMVPGLSEKDVRGLALEGAVFALSDGSRVEDFFEEGDGEAEAGGASWVFCGCDLWSSYPTAARKARAPSKAQLERPCDKVYPESKGLVSAVRPTAPCSRFRSRLRSA